MCSLLCCRFVLTVPRSLVASIEDRDATTQAWDNAVDAMSDLLGVGLHAQAQPAAHCTAMLCINC